MPRLPPLRIAALEDLADQLRFAPRRTLRRQIDRIEKLAAEIDPASNYPEDWVVFRVTGFRAERDNPAVIVGAALLADLSALAEHLSSAARLGPDDVEAGALNVTDLCDRWKITRRTLERYRRAGLVARRIRLDPRRVQLVFSHRAVENFEQRQRPRLDAAAKFRRITPQERHAIIEEAREMHRVAGWSLHAAARRLARRHGRAVETMRQLLLRHDRAALAAGQPPIFDARPALDVQQRRAVLAAHLKGIPIDRIARRHARTRASIHRIINERRAELLRRALAPVGADSDPADARRAPRPDALLEPMAVRSTLGAPPILDLYAFVEAAGAAQPPDAEAETARALAFRALCADARSRTASLSRSNPSASELDRIETSLRWATLLKRELVRGESRLILRSIEDWTARPILSLAPELAARLITAGFDAVAAAVDRFDPSSPGRLAAPASLALSRMLASTPGLRDEIESGLRGAARRRTSARPAIEDWTLRLSPWQTWLDMPPLVRLGMDRLPAPRRAPIAARFGHHTWGGPPLTIAELRAEFGITSQQWHALYMQAVALGRRDAADR